MRTNLRFLVVLAVCISSPVACGGSIDPGGSSVGSGSSSGGGGGSGQGGASGGASSHAPNCGPVSGEPKTIGPLNASAMNMVADSDAVYWYEEDGRGHTKPAVVRWDVKAGTLTSVAEVRFSMMVGDATDLFWSNGSQQLGRIAKNGSSSEVLFTSRVPPTQGIQATEGWYDLTVDETFAYWADLRTAGGIYRGPKVGGPSELLVAETSPSGVAVDDDAVYWVSRAGLKKWSKSTAQTTVLSTEPAGGGLGSKNLQVDGQFVYWMSTRGIERTPKQGGASEVFVARAPYDKNGVVGISIQAGCMYYGAGTSLYRRPLTDGPEVQVASSTHALNIFWFAANQTGVFWTDWSGFEDKGAVYMLPLDP